MKRSKIWPIYELVGMKLLRMRFRWPVGLLLWLLLVGIGYAWLLRYDLTAGGALAAPRSIPAWLSGAPDSAGSQLVIALHPRCPCSRATLRELAKILTRAPGTADVTVLMFIPRNAEEEWMEGALLTEARRLNCRIQPDYGGELAASLGSLTSGGVALYDSHGRLRYQGGITVSRGHEGDNAGELAVIEILRGGASHHESLPVFGCPIRAGTEPAL